MAGLLILRRKETEKEVVALFSIVGSLVMIVGMWFILPMACDSGAVERHILNKVSHPPILPLQQALLRDGITTPDGASRGRRLNLNGSRLGSKQIRIMREKGLLMMSAGVRRKIERGNQTYSECRPLLQSEEVGGFGEICF